MIVELNEKEFEVLKKILGEAYDAVTDRNNIKDRKQKCSSYFTQVMKRLKNALEEKGIDSKMTNYRALSFGKYEVTLYNREEDYDDVKEWGKNYDGAESGDDASYSQMENTVVLRLWFRGELVDEAKFDPRNTPGMVKWIIKWAFTNTEQ